MPSDATLTLPASEQVAPGTTTDISGISYSDSFAAANPGEMYLSITDTSGDLTAIDSAGTAPGSGTNSITLNATDANVQAILSSLAYIAPSSSGSDTINFDLWDQQGIESTGTIPVAIASGGTAETWTGTTSSDWNTASNWSGGFVPASGDTVSVPGATSNAPSLSNATLTNETITVSGSATVTFTNVTLNSILQSANTGNIDIGGTLTIGPQGTLGPQQNGSLFVTSLGSVVPIINDGVIEAPAGALLTFDNGGTVTNASVTISNNGLISANGGNISFDFAPPPFGDAPPETLTNAGSITITNNGGLTLNGTFAGNSVAFADAGTLSLQAPDAFAGGAAVTGFGPGDEIDLYGAAQGAPLAYASGILTVGTAASIPLPGTFGVGNFETEFTGGSGNRQRIAYAPSGGPSGIVQPDITAPGSATVAQGSTLSLGDVSIDGSGTTQDTMSIQVTSGTLYMNGATGSGTSTLSFGPTPQGQLNADFASLIYVPSAGATSDTMAIDVSPPAPASTIREIPITITPGGTGPALREPTSEVVSPGATIAVSGSYSDSFAQHNPGELYIGISDSTGTLTAIDASGAPVPGSGTNSIGLSADDVDVNAILASLHDAAGNSAGSDTIQFQVWNQAGAETTGATTVTTDPPSTSAMMSQADFAAPIAAASASADMPSIAAPSLTAPYDGVNHPPGIVALSSH